jgi:hypothetical protein
MSTTPIPAGDAQTPVSGWGRIIGIFFSPKPTFEDIVRQPTWLLPVILLTVVSLAACISINQRINWNDFITQQMDKNPRAAQLSPEQKQERVAQGARFAPYFTYVYVAVPILSVLLVSLVMMGAYNLFAGAGVGYMTSMGIVAHAFLVWLVSSLLFLLVLFLKPYGTVDLENPVAANVAAFLPDGAAPWLVKFCNSLDIFSIWILILLGIGFAAANPRKLNGAKAFSIAFGVWAVYVLVRTGWAFVTS